MDTVTLTATVHSVTTPLGAPLPQDARAPLTVTLAPVPIGPDDPLLRLRPGQTIDVEVRILGPADPPRKTP